MYCKTCEADVAAEVSPDGKSLLCTTCGNEVRKSYAPSLSDDAKSARDLLERWSNAEVDDPFGPIGRADSGHSSESATRSETADHAVSDNASQPNSPNVDNPSGTDQTTKPPHDVVPPLKPGEIQRKDAGETLSGPKIRHRRGTPPYQPDRREESGDLLEPPRSSDRKRPSEQVLSDDDVIPRQPSPPPSSTRNDSRSNKVYRIDAAHTRTVEVDADGPNVPPPHQKPAPAMPDGHRLDARHEIPAPHMRTESFVPQTGNRPGRVESVAGQLLAYSGVGLLTVGTALILMGYLGGPPQYAPTGWLVATVGQMILLLGVVTLISGGMQQTTHEVGMRVADLGTRLGRIEETTELALNSPHFLSRGQNTAGRRSTVSTDRDHGFENG